ncbi:phosphoadenylyl-sulfate reductase [Paracoccus suum]|uniref:phosphoadenylyl-sulfate reductase n=1 Tax=Paracoccus suum TaxID=2259340 RepID=UPI0013B06DF4|nr:phosphoadenylyl-sulfate reductase [Paracoccus suum]
MARHALAELPPLVSEAHVDDPAPITGAPLSPRPNLPTPGIPLVVPGASSRAARAPDLTSRAATLDAQLGDLTAQALIARALRGEDGLGRIAVVSSFGAESAVLLHMVAEIDPAAPVLFLDTGMHFPETLDYLDKLTAHLGLTNVQRVTPDAGRLAGADPAATLHRHNAAACCDLRKTQPLAAALAGFDGWITGRKRNQAASRSALRAVEAEAPSRLKLNPLRDWDTVMLRDYAARHGLPAHPLVARGYPSIGCATCTTPVAAGEDPRAGRWRGSEMTECGIHLIGGRMVRDADRRVIVTDTGTRRETAEDAAGVILAPENAPNPTEAASGSTVIEVAFPAFSDGRGFTLGKQLRAAGFTGRLRAAGPLLPDQYAMARRAGFDEVALAPALFDRQGGASVWASRADWQQHDHRARLAG